MRRYLRKMLDEILLEIFLNTDVYKNSQHVGIHKDSKLKIQKSFVIPIIFYGEIDNEEIKQFCEETYSCISFDPLSLYFTMDV